MQNNASRMAAELMSILERIQSIPQAKLQLTGSGVPGEQSTNYVLFLRQNTSVTADLIQRCVDWIQGLDHDPIGSGAYALHDILMLQDIHVAVESVAVSTLATDIVSGIVLPGEAVVKTSLFSLAQVAQAYTLGLKPVRVSPRDVFTLGLPLVAHLSTESYITVTGIDEAYVQYSTWGQLESKPIEKLKAELSGFTLAPEAILWHSQVYEELTDTLCAFVWG